MNWEIETDIYTLPCIKQTAVRKMPYSTGSSARCSVVTWRGGMRVRWEGGSRERIHAYLKLIYLVVQKKTTQHLEAT